MLLRLLDRSLLPASVVVALITMSTPGSIWAQTPAPQASLLETLTVFAGLDGSKQPQDLGINAHMGVRFSGNWSVPVVRNLGLGLQLGIGQNISDAAVHVLDQLQDSSKRTQTFITVGMFQRLENGLEWGVAYDDLTQQYYDDARLAQWRGRVGYDLRTSDQIGVNWRAGLRGDDNVVLDTPVRLDSIAQVDFFHRHTWANGAQTTVNVGIAGGHDNVVFVFPDDTRDDNVLAYGATLSVPLSDKFAIFGSANLITPASTGAVDAFLGVAWSPSRGMIRAVSNRFTPMLPVANNPDFAVNLKR